MWGSGSGFELFFEIRSVWQTLPPVPFAVGDVDVNHNELFFDFFRFDFDGLCLPFSASAGNCFSKKNIVPLVH